MLLPSPLKYAMAVSLFVGTSPALAQMMTNGYGPITLEAAKSAAAPAVAEARKNGWAMAVAIVDSAGNLVYFEKMDGTQTRPRSSSDPPRRSRTRSPRAGRASASCAWRARCRWRGVFPSSWAAMSWARSGSRGPRARRMASAPRRARTA